MDRSHDQYPRLPKHAPPGVISFDPPDTHHFSFEAPRRITDKINVAGFLIFSLILALCLAVALARNQQLAAEAKQAKEELVRVSAGISSAAESRYSQLLHKIGQLEHIHEARISKLREDENMLKTTLLKHEETIQQQSRSLAEQEESLKLNLQQYERAIKEKDRLFEGSFNNGNHSLHYVASLIADHLTLQYKISAEYLKTKSHPAPKEAKRVRELHAQTQEMIHKNKVLQYKYEYLFQLFPDLELYADDVNTIHELSCLSSVEQLADYTDQVRQYLFADEYTKLSENDRNQLALERYTRASKSKWQIGRDYELFSGYEYSIDGWSVEYTGIEHGIEDLGRDLIASKGSEVHVVQCKYWAQGKMIHEKHIAQLFGTTVMYKLGSSSNRSITPVLITNISLSRTAQKFAEHLGVKIIENKEMREFPRIKCNIGLNDYGSPEKIYHLPMDQQYDSAKICNPGEFFAFTVDEAVKAGFRRAWRWRGGNM